jgi:hypothetical protein
MPEVILEVEKVSKSFPGVNQKLLFQVPEKP